MLMKKRYKAGDKVVELKPLNLSSDVVFYPYVPTKVKDYLSNGMKERGFDLNEVESIEGEHHRFEFGYASNFHASLMIVGRMPWYERMVLWLDIIEHDPSQLPLLRANLEKEEEYDW